MIGRKPTHTCMYTAVALPVQLSLIHIFVSFVTKERLNQMSETGNHQGVIAMAASYEYVSVEEILARAGEKEEAPFLFLLDGIEDPHNLGAIIRTANLAGAHGVIITKHRAAGLTATVAKASAGAVNYTPVAKVTNLTNTIEQLKKEGIWFVCADMGGTRMYDLDLRGPVGPVSYTHLDVYKRQSVPTAASVDGFLSTIAAMTWNGMKKSLPAQAPLYVFADTDI